MKNIFYILMVAVLFCGCKKEFDDPMSDSSKGAISGTITDSKTGEPIGGVNIRCIDPYNGDYVNFTDSYGQYEVLGIYPGNYFLRIYKEGYRTINDYGVTVQKGKTTTVNIKMEPD